MWNKKSKEEKQKIREEKREEKRNRPGTFYGIVRLSKMLFKKRDYNIQERKVTKEDKKAIIITAIIIIGLGLLLWFLPFTHQFFEDVIFLRK